MSHGKFEEILFSAEKQVVGSYTDSLLSSLFAHKTESNRSEKHNFFE